MKKGNKKLQIDSWFDTSKTSAAIRTDISHIQNLIVGATLGYRYKMRMVYAHFPINDSIGNTNKILEEEDEQGVAHIVEHLAFNATTKYTNHDIVKFLESIGAEFGACQKAMTSADDTVYELFVLVDKSEVRVSTEDLEKERGAVMEEYRGNRNANGRMQDSHWALMMAGSKVFYFMKKSVMITADRRQSAFDLGCDHYKISGHFAHCVVDAVGTRNFNLKMFAHCDPHEAVGQAVQASFSHDHSVRLHSVARGNLCS